MNQLSTIPSHNASVTNDAYDIDNEFVNSNAEATDQNRRLFELFFCAVVNQKYINDRPTVIKFDFEKHSIGKIIRTKHHYRVLLAESKHSQSNFRFCAQIHCLNSQRRIGES